MNIRIIMHIIVIENNLLIFNGVVIYITYFDLFIIFRFI